MNKIMKLLIINSNKKLSPKNKIIYSIYIIIYKCVEIDIEFPDITFYLIKDFIDKVTLRLNKI